MKRRLVLAYGGMAAIPSFAALAPLTSREKIPNIEECWYDGRTSERPGVTMRFFYRREDDKVTVMIGGQIESIITESSDGSSVLVTHPGKFVAKKFSFNGKIYGLPHGGHQEGVVLDVSSTAEIPLSPEFPVFVDVEVVGRETKYFYTIPGTQARFAFVRVFRSNSRLPYLVETQRIDNATNEILDGSVLKRVG
jgi:hypothetical protein